MVTRCSLESGTPWGTISRLQRPVDTRTKSTPRQKAFQIFRYRYCNWWWWWWPGAPWSLGGTISGEHQPGFHQYWHIEGSFPPRLKIAFKIYWYRYRISLTSIKLKKKCDVSNGWAQFPLYQLTQRDGILVISKQGDELAFFTLPLLVISRRIEETSQCFPPNEIAWFTFLASR